MSCCKQNYDSRSLDLMRMTTNLSQVIHMAANTTKAPQTTTLPTTTTTEAEDSEFATSQATLIIVVIMLALFTIFGVVGNAICFFIYSKKRDKTTSNVFILALAATDFVVCLLVVPYTIAAELLEYVFVYDFVCKFYMFCITSNIPLSAFIMTAIAFDRYCCICHPFLHVLTVERAKITCVVLTIISAGLGIITSLNFGVYHMHREFLPLEIENTTSFNVTSNMTSAFNQSKYDLVEIISELNDTDISDNRTSVSENITLVEHRTIQYSGVCVPAELILPLNFTEIYQKIYAGIFLLLVVIEAVLYALIYRSILVRRRWRSKRKRMSCYTSVNGVETMAEETQLTVINGNNQSDDKKTKRTFQSRQAAIREKTLYANIKTAAMLFVVTIVFIISFLPSWLMGLQYMPFNVIIFNLYYLNNVANPVIYAFMNRAFRDDLRALIKGCK